MDDSSSDPLLSHLNPPQREAVTHGDGALLVLAGAGSGKTRVLTHRIAWLIERRGVDPRAILALTFTNKAAREMQARVDALLPGRAGGLWLGTFHAIALRILRRHAELLPVGPDFGVYDADDQVKLAKKVVDQLGLDPKRFRPAALLGQVSRAKDEGRGPEEFAGGVRGNPFVKALYDFYALYQKKLQEARALDFGDLLLSTFRLFAAHPEVAEHYARRFRHVLIDEYQDTNRIQHLLAQRLASQWGNLCVVGDDDQSIYGWRGADLRNILAFEESFPGVRIVKLEQNYRSAAPILDAAASVIRRNRSRRDKTLWTERKEGAPLSVYVADTEEEEALWIVGRLAALAQEGYRPSDCAVLYRTHALSRPVEDALVAARLPYAVFGGLRFYERREIKDTLAFLRLALRPDDAVAFARVVNTPPRGIGDRTVAAVTAEAARREAGVWRAAQACVSEGVLTARAAKALAAFLGLVDGWREALETTPVNFLLDRILDETGYRDALRQEGEQGVDRLENISELLSAAEAFARDGETSGRAAVAEFLDRAALVSDLDRAAIASLDAVTLMTIHSAKGLEYPVVFVTGMEEGVFPHALSLDTDEGVEEERRLCYVAFTRARDRLFLSRARVRRVYGAESILREPSRFLRELSGAEIKPERAVEKLFDEARATSTFRRRAPPAAPESQEVSYDEAQAGGGGGDGSYYVPDPDHCTYRTGMRVRHDRFGEGRVAAVEGQGPLARLTVDFSSGGRKKFVAGLSRLGIKRDS